MTPTSGIITIYDVRLELNKTGSCGIGDTDARALAGKTSGTIALSDFYGKYRSRVWSYGPNWPLGAKYYLAGAGTHTAAVFWSGGTVNTYEYNGTAWAAGGNSTVAYYWPASSGTQTAAHSLGGSNQYYTHKYNGTSWSASTTMSGWRPVYNSTSPGGHSGTSSTASTTAVATYTRSYNGSAFGTLANSLRNAKEESSGGGSGWAMKSAGYHESYTQYFNATSWISGHFSSGYKCSRIHASNYERNIQSNGWGGNGYNAQTQMFIGGPTGASSNVSSGLTIKDRCGASGDTENAINVGGYNDSGYVATMELFV